MLGRNSREIGRRQTPAGGTVRGERGVAAHPYPVGNDRAIAVGSRSAWLRFGHDRQAGLEHDLIVVAQKRNQRALFFECDQLVQHASAVRAAVHIVTERDDDVDVLRFYDIEQTLECSRASVYVTDGYRARPHGPSSGRGTAWAERLEPV